MQRPDQTWTQGKERIHSCHHWVDFSMTLGHTGQRTIGWRRHGWALKLKWKRTTDHTRLWDPKCHQSAKNRRVFRSTSRQEHPCSTYMISFFSRKIDTFFHYVSHFYIFSSKKNKKIKKRKTKKHKLTSRNIFSIENQMQVIPLARNPREKKMKKKQKEKQHKKKKKKQVTVLQFVPNHCYAIHVWKIVPRNHAVVICSDIVSHVYGSCCFHMFMVHVERSGTFLPFFVGISTQSPLPSSSCLEYGGLQCSHIFIIRCVFYCLHSWFISFPGAF